METFEFQEHLSEKIAVFFILCWSSSIDVIDYCETIMNNVGKIFTQTQEELII